MTRNSPLTRLLDGQSVEPPFPLSTDRDAAAILDYLSETSHGPCGRGPESEGAALAAGILAFQIQGDHDVSRMLGILRAATVHEEPSERRSPSASIALEAVGAVDRLRRSFADELSAAGEGSEVSAALRRTLDDLLPTPIHARYALSLVIEGIEDLLGDLERSGHRTAIFAVIAGHLVGHPDAEAVDRAYVERLSAHLARRGAVECG